MDLNLPPLIFQFIDLIWLPVGLFVVHKGQRLITAAFFIACFLMMRFEIEMMQSMGFETGVLPLIHIPLFVRGLAVYSFFYLIYLAIAYWSPGSNQHIHLAASISLFFGAFAVSMVLMAL